MKEKKKAIFSDLLFLTITLIFLWVSFISYQRIVRLNDDYGWISHSHFVKLKLEQLLSNVKDAEATQREFLLTKDAAFLQPLNVSIENSNTLLSELDSLTIDNKSQQEKTLQLKNLVTERFTKLNNGIQLYHDKSSVIPNSLQEGRDQMNKVKLLAKFMIQDEDHLLNERTKEKNKSVSITPRYTLLLSLAAILVVVIAYFRMRVEKNLRFRAEDSEATIHNFFMQVPAMVAIVKGSEHRFEFINPAFSELLGKEDLTGKTVYESIPALNGEAYHEILNEVYETGKPFIGKEMKISYGKIENGINMYVNLILQAYANTKGEKEGILVFGYDVSEQVIIRKQIEEIELRSRLAIDAANMGTFDWDLKNQQFLSSPRLIEIFGFGNKQDINHKQLISVFHPDDKLIRDRAVTDSLHKGSLEYVARVIWPDKSIHWINVFGKIIRNDRKEPVRMYGTVIDITRQKNILDELRESESKFRLLADSMPQLIWTGNASGELNYFNKAVYEFSGLSVNDLDEQGWLSIVHPDERDDNMKKWQLAVSTASEFIFEHRFRNYKGEYRWQLSRALPQKNIEGKIQMWVGTSTDIDEQKNFSARLQEKINERTFELAELNKELLLKNNIFEQAEDNALIGSYSLSLQTGEMEYSANLYRLLGYEPGEFIPSFEKYISFVHPDDKEQVMKDGNETFETKKLTEHVHRVITKNGIIKHFRSSGKFFGEGDAISMIGTVQDVSQDILLNEMLRKQNLELERSNTELESFNYIASHDLQEPLRKIQAFSHRIMEKDKGNLSESATDYFRRITNAAFRMQNLIDALISYSRTNATTATTVFTDLNILLESVKENLQDSIEEKNASIEYNNLPMVKIIPLQFQQLFINLISNSIKYSKKDIPPHIIITAINVSGKEIDDEVVNETINYWKISVEDNGIGFEQQYATKIFELFQRLHITSAYLGTGIGLAICSKIMRNHEGFINAFGRPGIGSTFNIYLPFKE
ncbi:MAG: PAS domain-containing protein [Ferruginibacter sp.]